MNTNLQLREMVSSTLQNVYHAFFVRRTGYRLVVGVSHSQLKGSGFAPHCPQPSYRHP